MIQQPRMSGNAQVWRVCFTIGHVTAQGRAIDQGLLAEVVTDLKIMLGEVCHGGRITVDAGFYLLTSGALTDETSTSVWSYGQGSEIPVTRFSRMASHIARRLTQESTLLVIEWMQGAVFFVSADALDEDLPAGSLAAD